LGLWKKVAVWGSLASILGLLIVISTLFLSENSNGTNIQIDQIKTGDQSQVFVGSKVIISGVSPKVIEELSKTLNLKVIERLLKNLDEKDVALQDRDVKLQELAEKYKELEERLAKRSAEENLVAQAKKKLDAGDLEGAEKLLLQSYEQNLQAIAEKNKSAAADAVELGLVKELQLDYSGAKIFFEKAVELEPGNSNYLNRLGLILYTLGDHQKAIDYPNVATIYNNLGRAWRSLGEYQKAIDYYIKALAIYLKVYGKQHPHVAPKSHRLLYKGAGHLSEGLWETAPPCCN
jgi:tetratricopeptide (TPR) repeat protein